MMRYRILLRWSAVAAIVAMPRMAFAQSSAAVTISGGTATDQLGRTSAAISASPRIAVLLAPGASIQLIGTAARYANEAWSLGGGTELAGRQPVGRFAALTLNGSVTGSHLGGSATGSFAAADALPALELRASRVRLYGGARVAAGSATEQRPVGGFPPLGGGQLASTRVARTGVGSVIGALVDLVNDPDRSVTVGVREERFGVAGIVAVDRLATAAISVRRASLSGSLGSRVAPDERRAISSAALSLPIGGPLSLDLAIGRYASNRLHGTPGGDYATAGVSWSFGGERTWIAPVPSRTPPPARGFTRLAIRAPAVRFVELAGDFNGWTLVPARRADNNVWYVDLRVPPGRYRYAFRVNGSDWRVPDGATAVDDGFGGKSAWLVVQ